MRGSTAATTINDDGFDAELKAIQEPSGTAAQAMLARGRVITYRESDTPPGHVVEEHPDGTREIVRIDLEAETDRP